MTKRLCLKGDKMKSISYDEFLDFLSQRYGDSVERIRSIDSFRELGLDSLTIFSILTDIEEKYKITLPIDDLTEIDTATKLYNYVINEIEKGQE